MFWLFSASSVEPAFADRVQANPALQVQPLHSGSGEVSPIPSWLSGPQTPNSRVLFWTISCRTIQDQIRRIGRGTAMKTTNISLGGFQAILERKEAELVHVLRNRDGIAIEKSADQMDEIQYASERDQEGRDAQGHSGHQGCSRSHRGRRREHRGLKWPTPPCRIQPLHSPKPDAWARFVAVCYS